MGLRPQTPAATKKGVKGRIVRARAATGQSWGAVTRAPPGGDKAAVRAPATPMPGRRLGQCAGAMPITGGGDRTRYAARFGHAGTLYVPGATRPRLTRRQMRAGNQPLRAGWLVDLDAKNGPSGCLPLVERDFTTGTSSARPPCPPPAAGSLEARTIKDGTSTASKRRGKQLWKTPHHHPAQHHRAHHRGGTRLCPGTKGGSEWEQVRSFAGHQCLRRRSPTWCGNVQIAPVEKVKAVSPASVVRIRRRGRAHFGKLDPPGQWAGYQRRDADSGKLSGSASCRPGVRGR